MLSIFANTFMIATGNPNSDKLASQPNYSWYQRWHRFSLFLTGQ